MKFTLITTGLFAFCFIHTTSASPHNRRRGVSGWGIGDYGGTVNETPTDSTPTTETLAVLASSTDPAADPTTTTTANPMATPTAIKRGVHYLGDSYRGRGGAGARSGAGEVDMLAELLNHSFERKHLQVGGECSPKHKGCAGNSVVECGSEGVWELVADCDVPGLELECRAVKERDLWTGGWALNVICLQSDLVQ